MKIHLCTWPHGAGGDTRDIARGMQEERAPMFQRPIRVLLSYHYYKDKDVGALLDECFAGIDIDVFADSGAWSAFSIGQPVDEGEYIAWVSRWKSRFTAVAGPDVIGDAAKTAAATERMIALDLGVPVLPVFHVGEDWAFLPRYAAISDYLAFGGMVPLTRERDLLRAWCRKAFSLLPDGHKVHGFGMTTWPVLLEFPWYSVDSSSWTSCFRYATLQLFDSRRGRMVDVDMRNKKALLASSQILATYGLKPSEVQSKGYNRDLLCAVSVESWQRAEAWLSDRRESRAYLSLGTSSRGGGPGAAANNIRVFGGAVRTYLAAGAHPAGPNATHGAGDVQSLAAGVRTSRARRAKE